MFAVFLLDEWLKQSIHLLLIIIMIHRMFIQFKTFLQSTYRQNVSTCCDCIDVIWL